MKKEIISVLSGAIIGAGTVGKIMYEKENEVQKISNKHLRIF